VIIGIPPVLVEEDAAVDAAEAADDAAEAADPVLALELDAELDPLLAAVELAAELDPVVVVADAELAALAMAPAVSVTTWICSLKFEMTVEEEEEVCVDPKTPEFE
jgi:hypothetical protein